MLQSVEGTYEEGELRLKEPVNIHGRWKIVVTFLEEASEEAYTELEEDDPTTVLTFYSRHTDERLREIDRAKLEARQVNRPY